MVRARARPQDRGMTQTPHDGPADESRPDAESENAASGHSDTKTEGPRVSAEQARDLGRLRRSVTDRKIAGVAGGLGRHFDVDPTVLRVAFVVLCFFGGAGFVLYGAAWLLVPEEGETEANISMSPNTRNTALIIAGAVAALLLIGDGWWGGWGFPWPLAILGLILFLVLRSKDKDKDKHVNTPPQGQWAGPVREDGSTATLTEQPAWMPPATQTYQAPAPKPDRGPKLFWFTIALVAVALGGLGLFDVAGVDFPDAAYPALALAVIGAMLVVGAWVGRAGGLIAMGIIAAVVLAGSSVAQTFDGPRVTRAPTQAGELRSSYFTPAGSIHLDLTDIENLEALDGRTVDVEANVGELVVTVPDDLTVDIAAEVDGGGEINVLGQSEGGNNVAVEQRIDGGQDAPELDLNLDLVFGSIEVRQP